MRAAHLPRTALAVFTTAAFAAAQWGPMTVATPPAARSGAMMAYDALQSRMVMFGGNSTNELWSYFNGAWSQLTPTSSPSPRMRSAMASVLTSGEILLYGGIDGSTTSQFAADDSWRWDGFDWHLLAPSTTPGGRARHMMAYDLARQVMVVYGGRQNLWVPNEALATTWEFQNGDWTQVVPVNSPPGLCDAAMAYLTTTSRVVMFGGSDNTGTAHDETWLYDGLDWQQVATTGPRPAPRVGARMEMVLSRGVLVLVGGRDPLTQTIFNDTWEFDGTGWSEVQGVYAGMYPPRDQFAMAHDFVHDRIVAFGGVIANGGLRDDTYEFGAQFQPFGIPCPGTAGVPQLGLVTLPQLNSVCSVTVDHLVPTMPFAVMAVGLSRTQWALGSLPALLTGLGMPGCRSYTSADLLVPIPAINGTATWSFDFATLPSTLGDTYYLQGISVDPGANPAWLVTSNAATLVVGY